MDFSVPLTHHDPKDHGLICLVKKRKNLFLDSFGFKNPISDFLKTAPVKVKMNVEVEKQKEYLNLKNESPMQRRLIN